MRDNDIILILSGDQLYRMDLADLVQHHIDLKADATISAKPVPEYKSSAFGVIAMDDDFRIKKFVEKCVGRNQAEGFEIPQSMRNGWKSKVSTNAYFASMGIDVFTAKVLADIWAAENGSDFDKDIIPNVLALGEHKMYGYVFDGFLEDVGTVRSFLNTNLMLTDIIPEFDFFDAENPIYTHARYLPACKGNSSRIENTLLSDGCIIADAILSRYVIGLSSVIRKNASLENVLMFGADCFDSNGSGKQGSKLGVGENSVIKKAIVDINVRIGRNVYLSPDGKPDDHECDGLCVKDGILCVMSKTVVGNNTIFLETSWLVEFAVYEGVQVRNFYLFLCLCAVCLHTQLLAGDFNKSGNMRRGIPCAGPGSSMEDEVKERAQETFDNVLKTLPRRGKARRVKFPSKIVCLSGSPGSGQGTRVSSIMRTLEISNKLNQVSSLLDNPKDQETKASGNLVDDEWVISRVFKALTHPEYSKGVIVDGFPRTLVQAICLKLLANKMRTEGGNEPNSFGIVNCVVSRKTSVER